MHDEFDNDEEMTEKDWVEYYNEKDKKFTYDHLFNRSESLDQTKYENFKQWNAFSVKGFENYKQIFYDIANSKKARSWYRKITWYSILSIFVRLIPILFACIAYYGAIRSKQGHFSIFDDEDWIKIVFVTSSFFVLYFILSIIFRKYDSTEEFGKIDLSYWSNKTDPKKIVKRPSFNLFSFRIKTAKPRFESKYYKYVANDGKKYLIDKDFKESYFKIRNWYLVSKYITCGKVEIKDLPWHFQDELFFYLTTKDYKPEKLKLRCIFGLKFSLNSLQFVEYVILPLLYIAIPFFSIVLGINLMIY